MTKLLHRDAVRCEPYSDGPWFFAYDPRHLGALRELRASEALVGGASGSDADRRLGRIAEEGLALACELAQDWVIADVLVGKKLSSGQKKKAEWVDAQRGYLRVPSGRLRVESLNSLSFAPEEPSSEGCELEVPPGDYDVVVHRVAWELMDVGSREERPELPAVVLELLPVGKNGPKTKAAYLTLAAARGEVGAWLIAGSVDDGTFHGTTRAHSYEPSIAYLNLRGTHAEEMGLRFGKTLEIAAGDVRVSARFTGCLTRNGMEGYFGPDWYGKHMADVEVISGRSPFEASPPWLVDVEGSALPGGVPVTARVGEDWCDVPEPFRDAVEVGKGTVSGRVVFASPGTVILNFGPDELRRAGLGSAAALELVVGERSRAVHRYASPGELAELRRAVLDSGTPRSEYVPTGALLANTMTYWDDPEVSLLWLIALMGDCDWEDPKPGSLYSFLPRPGDRHHLEVSRGSGVVLRAVLR